MRRKYFSSSSLLELVLEKVCLVVRMTKLGVYFYDAERVVG
jgi:hypothetical protein